MSLKKYISKRKFSDSTEPKGKVSKISGKLQFVIQKHEASHLHYDFRIQLDGVLKSWAIPKGPSLDPNIKRLAIMVEDHPYDYRKFEGVIPKGYGAGTVMIWDQGNYSVDGKSAKESESLIREGLKKGSIHFSLEGEKLQGKFSLIKLKKSENEWLFIKMNDSFITKENITKKELSVISGKTLAEISNGTITPIKKTRKINQSQSVKPMLTTLIDKPFDNKDWIFEIKWDGFRAIAELHSNKVDIYSRNSLSFNEQFPQIVKDLKALKINAIFDGEIVAIDKNGVSQFQILQNQKESDVYFYIFDILFLDGKDLCNVPLIQRKLILKNLLKKEHSHIRYCDHIEEQGKSFFRLCKKRGCEGIIGKKKESLYVQGARVKDWVKIKVEKHQEVIICGFTEPKKTRKNFGALIIGIYKNGNLKFAGHVGGGFTEKQLKDLKSFFIPLIIKKCPFKNPPKTNSPVTWIKPQIICEVKFKEWTKDGIMRQPIFLGIRKDKSPKSIIKEKPNSIKKIAKSPSQSKKRILNIDAKKYNFLTHLEKDYWEAEHITKKDLLNYYVSIAPFILPYLKDRPESLKRFPNGISNPSFFQKNLKSHPEWVSTVSIENHNHKMVHYLVIQDIESLLYAVNMGCIEIHPWFSRHQSIDNPDFLIFDLDPENISFNAVIETAQVIHTILEKIKVPSYCKTSGARGLHIAIPLKAKYSYEQSKQFAELIAMLAYQILPNIVSLERKPKDRQNKVYIDCFQNNFGQTLIAPYSVRAKPKAPVSTPLEWKEVKAGLDPSDYNIFNILDRIKKKGDIFKPILHKGIDLEKGLQLLQNIFIF